MLRRETGATPDQHAMSVLGALNGPRVVLADPFDRVGTSSNPALTFRSRSLSDQLALAGLIIPAVLLLLVLVWVLLLVSGHRRGSIRIKGLGLQVSVDTADDTKPHSAGDGLR